MDAETLARKRLEVEAVARRRKRSKEWIDRQVNAYELEHSEAEPALPMGGKADQPARKRKKAK